MKCTPFLCRFIYQKTNDISSIFWSLGRKVLLSNFLAVKSFLKLSEIQCLNQKGELEILRVAANIGPI